LVTNLVINNLFGGKFVTKYGSKISLNKGEILGVPEKNVLNIGGLRSPECDMWVVSFQMTENAMSASLHLSEAYDESIGEPDV
jgi:hypothetical protein